MRRPITSLAISWNVPRVLLILLEAVLLLQCCCDALSLPPPPFLKSRRALWQDCVTTTTMPAAAAAAITTSWLLFPIESAQAKEDCIKDCLANCKSIAPKDPGYCQENCKDYCDQPDRTGASSQCTIEKEGVHNKSVVLCVYQAACLL
jgi:hypothetical protein